MKGTSSRLTTGATFEDAPTGISRAFNGFNDVEHADLIRIERGEIATEGTRHGLNPTSLDRSQHGV